MLPEPGAAPSRVSGFDALRAQLAELSVHLFVVSAARSLGRAAASRKGALDRQAAWRAGSRLVRREHDRQARHLCLRCVARACCEARAAQSRGRRGGSRGARGRGSSRDRLALGRRRRRDGRRADADARAHRGTAARRAPAAATECRARALRCRLCGHFIRDRYLAKWRRVLSARSPAQSALRRGRVHALSNVDARGLWSRSAHRSSPGGDDDWPAARALLACRSRARGVLAARRGAAHHRAAGPASHRAASRHAPSMGRLAAGARSGCRWSDPCAPSPWAARTCSSAISTT